MEENRTWEEPYIMNDKTEPVQSFEAFKIWVEMGNKRSLKAVAERMEKSHDTIKKYSCTWKWSERLQEKLSYESNLIYGKQMEMVLSGLEIDSKRDVVLQVTLGNILRSIIELTLNDPSKMRPQYNPLSEKIEPNKDMEVLKNLTNIYSKLEQIHTKTQQKIIDYNNKCLSVQSFKDTGDYDKLIKNGQKEIMEFMGDYMHNVTEQTGTNWGGMAYLQGNVFKSYQQEAPAELETEATPEAITEAEGGTKKKTSPRRKKKTKRRTNRSRRGKK